MDFTLSPKTESSMDFLSVFMEAEQSLWVGGEGLIFAKKKKKKKSKVTE